MVRGPRALVQPLVGGLQGAPFDWAVSPTLLGDHDHWGHNL